MNDRELGWACITGTNSNTQLVLHFRIVLVVFEIMKKKII